MLTVLTLLFNEIQFSHLEQWCSPTKQHSEPRPENMRPKVTMPTYWFDYLFTVCYFVYQYLLIFLKQFSTLSLAYFRVFLSNNHEGENGLNMILTMRGKDRGTKCFISSYRKIMRYLMTSNNGILQLWAKRENIRLNIRRG